VTLGLLLWLKRAVLLTKAKLLILLLPFLLGISPLIVGNVQEPLGTAKTLAQKFKVKGRTSGLDSQAKINQVMKILLVRLKEFPLGAGRNLSILFGKGETWIAESEIPETTRIKNLPEVPWLFWFIPFFFATPLLAGCYRKIKASVTSPARRNFVACINDLGKVDVLILLFFVSLLAYFSPTYLFLCYPLAAILAAAFLDNLRGAYVKTLYTVLLLATISLNAYGIVDLALNQRDGSIPKLINALEAKGCSYGYSSGPMYQIAFYSLERTILVPLDSKNRYRPYEAEVRKAPNICYVFRPDQERKIDHRAFLKILQQENIRYHETTVNSDTVYHIYYSLAPREKIPPNVREKLKLIRKDLRSVDVPRQIGLSGAVQKALSVNKISDRA
jgi:hypothetical protein